MNFNNKRSFSVDVFSELRHREYFARTHYFETLLQLLHDVSETSISNQWCFNADIWFGIKVKSIYVPWNYFKVYWLLRVSHMVLNETIENNLLNNWKWKMPSYKKATFKFNKRSNTTISYTYSKFVIKHKALTYICIPKSNFISVTLSFSCIIKRINMKISNSIIIFRNFFSNFSLFQDISDLLQLPKIKSF